MTVKELIEKLSVLNPDTIVEIGSEEIYRDIENVIDLETRVVIQ